LDNINAARQEKNAAIQEARLARDEAKQNLASVKRSARAAEINVTHDQRTVERKQANLNQREADLTRVRNAVLGKPSQIRAVAKLMDKEIADLNTQVKAKQGEIDAQIKVRDAALSVADGSEFDMEYKVQVDKLAALQAQLDTLNGQLNGATSTKNDLITALGGDTKKAVQNAQNRVADAVDDVNAAQFALDADTSNPDWNFQSALTDAQETGNEDGN